MRTKTESEHRVVAGPPAGEDDVGQGAQRADPPGLGRVPARSWASAHRRSASTARPCSGHRLAMGRAIRRSRSPARANRRIAAVVDVEDANGVEGPLQAVLMPYGVGGSVAWPGRLEQGARDGDAELPAGVLAEGRTGAGAAGEQSASSIFASDGVVHRAAERRGGAAQSAGGEGRGRAPAQGGDQMPEQDLVVDRLGQIGHGARGQDARAGRGIGLGRDHDHGQGRLRRGEGAPEAAARFRPAG
jgi:hypothetical protein